MTTEKKVMTEVREFDLTEHELQLVRELRKVLKSEKDIENFEEIIVVSPVLLKVVRNFNAFMTTGGHMKRVLAWVLGGILFVNLLKDEFGKMITWLARLFT